MLKFWRTSERNYESIIIWSLNEHPVEKYNFNVLEHFAESVKQITFSGTSLQNYRFIKIIQIMKNLKVLRFEGGEWHGDPVTEVVKSDIVPSINEICIKQVDRFSFQNVYLFDAITTLYLNNWNSFLDYETFEMFL